MREPTVKPYLVKLVRDGIAERVVSDAVTYEPIRDRDMAIRMLRSKLIEEAVEYALDPSVHELADVLEAVEALTEIDLGATQCDLLDARMEKREARGGFEGLTGMWCQTSAGVWGVDEGAR